MADHQNRFFHRKKIMTIFFVCAAVLCGLLGRLLYLMVWRAEYYEEAATRLHERERSIKAARGRILDRNGVVLADNKMVCTVSVIHNQIEEPEQVIAILVKELGISEEEARKRVEKYSSIERVKSNVDKTVGDRIRGKSGRRLQEILSLRGSGQQGAGFYRRRQSGNHRTGSGI